MKNCTRQTGEWTAILRSPNTFDTRLGNRTSANVTHCAYAYVYVAIVSSEDMLA